MAGPLSLVGSSSSMNSPRSEGNGVHGNDALELLSQDELCPIPIAMKDMFTQILEALDVETEPVFTEQQCGSAGMMVTIKIDTVNLPSASEQRVWFAVVEGEPKLNCDDAVASAVKNAIKYLEKHHLITVADFSSTLVEKVDVKATHVVLSNAINALGNVLSQWDVALSFCDAFIAELEGKEGHDNIYAPVTPRGRVYGSVNAYISHQRNTFYHRTSEAKKGLNEARGVLDHYKLIHEGSSVLADTQHRREARLNYTFLLKYLMEFFGLPAPKYVTTPDNQSFVKSKVVIDFPVMTNFKYSGNIEVEGISYTSPQANEQAAYEALMLIEENFNLKVVDYNYSHRKKAMKDQDIISSQISDVLDLVDSVKMMFGEIIAAVEAQRGQFSFDPTNLFSGAMAAGQIEAFHFCARSVIALCQDLAKCYAACAHDFEVANRITWEHLVMESNLPE